MGYFRYYLLSIIYNLLLPIICNLLLLTSSFFSDLGQRTHLASKELRACSFALSSAEFFEL